MKYLIGSIVTILLLLIPIVVTEQGRNTVSCINHAASEPALEWEWCVWAFHDVEDTHHDMDVVQFKLKQALDEPEFSN